LNLGSIVNIVTHISVRNNVLTRRHGDTEKTKINENEIGGIVVDCAVKVPMRLGPGPAGSVYEAVPFYDSGEALMKDGIFRIINGKLE